MVPCCSAALEACESVGFGVEDNPLSNQIEASRDLFTTPLQRCQKWDMAATMSEIEELKTCFTAMDDSRLRKRASVPAADNPAMTRQTRGGAAAQPGGASTPRL